MSDEYEVFHFKELYKELPKKIAIIRDGKKMTFFLLEQLSIKNDNSEILVKYQTSSEVARSFLESL